MIRFDDLGTKPTEMGRGVPCESDSSKEGDLRGRRISSLDRPSPRREAETSSLDLDPLAFVSEVAWNVAQMVFGNIVKPASEVDAEEPRDGDFVATKPDVEGDFGDRLYALIERIKKDQPDLQWIDEGGGAISRSLFGVEEVPNPEDQPPLKNELGKLRAYLDEVFHRFAERKDYFASQPTRYTQEERDEEETTLRNVLYNFERLESKIRQGELSWEAPDLFKLSNLKSQVESLTVTCQEVVQPTWIEALSTGVCCCLRSLQSWIMAQDHEWKMQKYCMSLQEQKKHLEETLGCDEETLRCDLVTKKAAIESLHGKSPVDQYAIEYLNCLIRGSKDKAQARNDYYQALYQMRYALEHPEFETNTGLSGKLFRAAAYVRYSQNELYTFSESVVDLWLKTGRQLSEDSTPLEHFIQERDAEDIQHTRAVLGADRLAVERGKLQGTININFDPNAQSNVPYVLADVDMCDEAGTPVKRRMLRMGTPTREGVIYPAEVIPEFRAYLAEAQKKGEGHLYVSLQSHRPKDLGKVGDETKRTEAIKALQEEFPSTFTFVVFAQDTKFYKEPLGEGDKPSREFIKQFRAEMLGESNKTGFYFPEGLKDESMLDEVMNQVHQLVFEGRETLTLQERQDFLEITYAMLIPRLAAKTGATMLNVTCKDAIDRAAKLNCLTLKLAQIMQGKGTDPASRRRLQKATYAPAIFTKKQAIISSRRQRMLSALEWLNRPEVIDRIREAAQEGNLGINAGSPNGVHFEEVPSQAIDFCA